MYRSAFTVIELLIVIAIIAVLAGMTYGAIGQLRSMAESRNCMGNLRQMQMANMSYSQDNRGYYVCVYFLNNANGKLNPWRQNKAFLAYFTDDGVANDSIADSTVGDKVSSKLLCPTVRNVVRARNTGLFKLEYSYGLNTQNVPAKTGNIGPTIRTPNVGSKIIFLDALDWEITNTWRLGDRYLTNVPPTPEGNFAGQTVAFRHSKNANFVLGDGSAASKGFAYLRDYNPTAANNFSSLWNP